MHYDDVIMTMLASQITSLTVVYSIVYSDVNQRKHQSSASLAFVREIHRGPVNFPHKWPVTRKMFPFDDVIMECCCPCTLNMTDINFAIRLSIATLLLWVRPTPTDSNLYWILKNWQKRYINVIQNCLSAVAFGHVVSHMIICSHTKLTHLPLVPHICVSESSQHWFR